MPSKKSSKTKKSAKATSKKGTKKSSKAMNANKNGQPGEELKGADVRYSYIEGVTFGMKKVRYGAVNGEALFEGDIVLGSVGEMEAIKEQVENPQPDVELAVVVKSQFRWPNGVIPFRIDPSLPNQQRVTDAIAHWHANTNVRFKLRTNESDFVTFRPANGCSANVGKRGGEQFVNLGTGCTTGNAIHEIGHAAGLWHEQSRRDRNSFVNINFPNIQPDMVFNFDQHITDGDDVGGYDYGSIMHYPRNAFAINPNIDTITPKPNANVQIGQRNGLSAGDIAAINAIYPRKATLGDTSTNGPALTTRSNQILLGWTGTGNLRLNFMSSNDGLTFSNKVTLGDVSPASLALTVFQNRFVVAWIGVGNNQLNIMQSNNGMSWSNKVTLGDTSESAPSLAVLGSQLFIAWRGVGNNRLNVMRSTDGIHWGGKVTLGDTTTSGPTLATLGTRLLLGWRGVGNNQLNVMQSTNGSSFTNKVTLGETTVQKPQLSISGSRAFLTWQGVGNQFLNVLASTNGINWGSKFTSNETCIGGPVITPLGNRLVWGWTGTDTNHRLNTMLFNVA
jgi:Astacin (Peptidase family M12A).